MCNAKILIYLVLCKYLNQKLTKKRIRLQSLATVFNQLQYSVSNKALITEINLS